MKLAQFHFDGRWSFSLESLTGYIRHIPPDTFSYIRKLSADVNTRLFSFVYTKDCDHTSAWHFPLTLCKIFFTVLCIFSDLPAHFLNVPYAFNGIVFAVIRRIIGQFEAHVLAADKIHQLYEQLRSRTPGIRAIIHIEDDRIRVRLSTKIRLNLVACVEKNAQDSKVLVGRCPKSSRFRNTLKVAKFR